MGWFRSNILGLGQKLVGKIGGLFGGHSKAGKEAIDRLTTLTDIPADRAAKIMEGVGKTGVLGKIGKALGFTLKAGAVAGGADLLLRGKDSIPGQIINELWVDAGKIEAEQNIIGRLHGFLTFAKEVLALFNIESEWLNNNVEKLGKKHDDLATTRDKIEDKIKELTENPVESTLNLVEDNPIAATALGAGAALYGGNRLRQKFSGGKNAPTNTPDTDDLKKMQSEMDDLAKGKTNPTVKAGKPGFFKNLLGKVAGVLPKLGRFGKIAGVATLTTGAAVTATGLTSGSAEASELPEGNTDTATPSAAEIDKGFFQTAAETAADGAHAFAHGFTDEVAETGAGLAGHFADAADLASGKVLSWFGVDTGYKNRDLSTEWAKEADGLADSLMGAPDLSSSFAKAAHTTGGFASWFIGPVAFGAAKLANAGAKIGTGVATKFGAASGGLVASGTGVAAGGGAVLTADIALTPNDP